MPASLTDSELVAALWRQVEPSKRNAYATDGKCHNAQRGSYNHECGKPATWTARKASGFASGFCDWCKVNGDERHGYAEWTRIVPETR